MIFYFLWYLNYVSNKIEVSNELLIGAIQSYRVEDEKNCLTIDILNFDDI